MKLVRLKQRSKEWLDFRRNHVCASDAPIIMGMSNFKTIDQLINEKVRGFEQHQNPHMVRGNELEPVALKAFEKETNIIMFPCVGVHDQNDWMAASFDGMTLEEDLIVEIKCPGKKDHWVASSGKVPEKYIAQLQHQIYVSGLDFSYYYSFDGEKGIVLEVKRDEEFIEKMLAMEIDFWNILQTEIERMNLKKAEHAITTI